MNKLVLVFTLLNLAFKKNSHDLSIQTPLFFQKPAAAGPSSKPAGVTAAAAAKSRLAAVKAAMKAKQQAAEKAAKEDGANGEETSCPDAQQPQTQGAPPHGSFVPLDEGLSQVHSPLKTPGQ